MHKRSILTLALLAAMPLSFTGCAAGLGGSDYSRGEARQTMSIRFATVESVRAVKLEGSKTPIGATAGAVAGGVVGRSLGKSGISATVGTALGAIAGGVGGAAAEEAVTRHDGVEITVARKRRIPRHRAGGRRRELPARRAGAAGGRRPSHTGDARRARARLRHEARPCFIRCS